MTLEVIGSANRFSLAAMLVCTNDGFAGIDGKRLPSELGGEHHYYARAFDAGTGDLTEAHAWSGPVLKVTIERSG